MQASSVINRARDILLDTDGIRWLDGDLVKYLESAEREILSRRPEANIYFDTESNQIAIQTYSPPGTTSSTLAISDRYMMCAAFLVSHYALMRDTSDPNNLRRAQECRNEFERHLAQV